MWCRQAQTSGLDGILKSGVKVLNRGVTCGTVGVKDVVGRVDIDSLGEVGAAVRCKLLIRRRGEKQDGGEIEVVHSGVKVLCSKSGVSFGLEL
jgi:hypothetical protein